jgi:hypothetical protein
MVAELLLGIVDVVGGAELDVVDDVVGGAELVVVDDVVDGVELVVVDATAGAGRLHVPPKVAVAPKSCSILSTSISMAEQPFAAALVAVVLVLVLELSVPPLVAFALATPEKKDQERSARRTSTIRLRRSHCF